MIRKIPIFKRVASYIFPIRIKNVNSDISGRLELNLVAGKLTLDTQNSNYSYGTLQSILNTGLSKIDLNDSFREILVLGMGGGSVIETIREKYKSNANIEAIEVDAEIIKIANDNFNIGRFQNLNVIHSDALDYVNKTSKLFDLIIVDLFIGNKIPNVFTESGFLEQICDLLNNSGVIIYNVMTESLKGDILLAIKAQFESKGLLVDELKNVEGSNSLILAKKIQPPASINK